MPSRNPFDETLLCARQPFVIENDVFLDIAIGLYGYCLAAGKNNVDAVVGVREQQEH